MNRKSAKGWLKHIDFILIDLLAMQIAFVVAYWINSGVRNPYAIRIFTNLAEILFLMQLVTAGFSNNYKNVLRRGYFEEFISVVRYMITVLILTLIFLFVIHRTQAVSRLQLGSTMLLFVILSHSFRLANKTRVEQRSGDGFRKKGKSLVIITTGALVDEAISKLTDSATYIDFFISGVIITDNDTESIKGEYNMPIVPLNKDALLRLRRKWVDEVFILQPSDTMVSRKLIKVISDMGITINFTLALLNDESWSSLDLRKLGNYKVLTSSVNIISFDQAVAKRILDIIGGLVGCIITGILFIFVAPAIYIKSPGPIFFAQERVGLGGKTFKMYKFRSMYMDAEERKAELMSQNKLDSDLMFKLDDDPRIIGSEKKDKNGKPKGIGNFIRNTSIERNVIMNLNQWIPVFARVSSTLSNSGYSHKMPIIAQNRGIMYARA